MEYLSGKLTDYILKKNMIQKEDYAIYQYGFQYFLELSAGTFCSIFIAVILNMLPQCLLFFLFFIPMRSYSGGIHLHSYAACFFTSCLVLVSTLFAASYLSIPSTLSFILYLFCAIIIKTTGPVNHPNREVDSQENQVFTTRTNLIMLLHLIIAIIFLLLHQKEGLFMEAMVYFILCITSLIGRIKYGKGQ